MNTEQTAGSRPSRPVGESFSFSFQRRYLEFGERNDLQIVWFSSARSQDYLDLANRSGQRYGVLTEYVYGIMNDLSLYCARYT